MIARVLEPEAIDSVEEAVEYDLMDHVDVNRRFVADFLASASRMRGVAPDGGYIVDVGAGTARTYTKGEAMGAPTPVELDTMRAVVRHAMEDGAFGIASALIYPPNTYASTAELTELAKAMSPYGGVYITHMRNEGDKLLEAIDEAIAIGKGAGVAVEIYHLKAAGVRNWPKMNLAIAKIDSARAAGQAAATSTRLPTF